MCVWGGRASLRNDISHKYAKWLPSLLPPTSGTGFVMISGRSLTARWAKCVHLKRIHGFFFSKVVL